MRKPDLRARGLALAEAHPEMSNAEIARAVGVSKSTVWGWRNPGRAQANLAKSDPGRARRRAWEQDPRNRLPCVGCGSATGYFKWEGDGRCRECHERVVNEERDRRRTRIQELWREGKTLREIAEAIGYSANSIGGEMARMRADGWDLPLRNNWSEEGLRASRTARRRVA